MLSCNIIFGKGGCGGGGGGGGDGGLFRAEAFVRINMALIFFINRARLFKTNDVVS